MSEVDRGQGELESYGDTGIESADAPVPKWLLFSYVLLPIWGVATLYFFWNGSEGWLDRGGWHELQEAAGTTYPYLPEEKQAERWLQEGEERR